MYLTLEQIKSVTVGAVSVWEEDKEFHFAKCTQKQIAAWYKVREDLGVRAETTTGIRLDFYTNSKIFAFMPKEKNRYEIYIDGALSYHYFEKGYGEDLRQEIRLDGKEHRITLYLPAHEKGVLKTVEIDDNATFRGHTYDCKILFIGDSITQGWDSTWDSLSFAQHVSRFFNAESVIQGIGGAVYHETTFDETIEFEPDMVVIAYGTNDWQFFQTIGDGKKHCVNFLDKVINRYGDKILFGISPLWRADSKQHMPMGTFEECTSYVKDEIRNHHMCLIEGENITPHVGEFYCDEVLHPNTSGFAIYALNLIKEMQKYL